MTDRCPSRTLQRRIADFGAERSFQNTAAALKEHYNIEVPFYTIDKATGDVARAAKHFKSQAPDSIKPAATLISEVDGSMLPIVGFREETTGRELATMGDPPAKRADKRQLRQCHWKEIRISTARLPWQRMRRADAPTRSVAPAIARLNAVMSAPRVTVRALTLLASRQPIGSSGGIESQVLSRS